MNLIGKIVVYKPMIGAATETEIVAQDEKNIYIRMPSKDMQLQFPQAFEKFLKFKDGDLQAAVEELISAVKMQEQERAREEREARLRAIEESERLEKEKTTANRRTKTPFSDRYADENNLAFKCNFCDGGCSSHCVGYKGVCSDAQIAYNIEKKKRAWCADKTGSPCYKYHMGMITREELDALYQNGDVVCYEARMLVEWKAEAGEDRNGENGPRTRRITGAAKDSLAVLTAEFPTLPGGKNRVIFGVFITGVVDEGDDVTAGYVKSKGDYHIELTPEEAKRMKFWDYYKNPNNAESVQWGSGLYRYMKDEVCVRILEDIVKIKNDPAEKAHAQRVLELYCELKGMNVNNIPATDEMM